ncbi:MAG: hypothetical protein KC589_01540 [Nanoarchaeota archaeon]|nr:hypothetical protein [Nanoarchaeota archaeon]
MKANKSTKIWNRIFITLLILVFSINFIFAADWWNSSYEYRDQINVSTGANSPYKGYKNYTVQIILNTTDSNIYLSSGNDIRIIWWNGSSNKSMNYLITKQFDNFSLSKEFIIALD